MQKMHETATKNHWFELSTFEQLAYIGCDIEVAINSRKNGYSEWCDNAIKRALELLELTIIDLQNTHRLKEIEIVKMLVMDDFYGNNEYQSTDESWIKYFACFQHLAKQTKEEDSVWHK